MVNDREGRQTGVFVDELGCVTKLELGCEFNT
jgi:hypothetical protein